MLFDRKEDILAITPLWKGERYEDGRPKVKDEYLDEIANMTLEEVWKAVYDAGYTNQYIQIKSLHPEFNNDGSVNRRLVGRAVTGAYVPTRPDYAVATRMIADEQGYTKGLPNQWIIDRLTDRDVIVIDMFDKIYQGTFVGGNLSTAIHTKTHTGGAVIWGAMRDIEQVQAIPDMQVYYRGTDPTGLRNIEMLSFNMPVRLGTNLEAVTVLPGDVVYGCSGGCLFVPPHLVEKVVEAGRKSKVKDMCGFALLKTGKFTTAQIDKKVWSLEQMQLLMDYIRTEPEAQKFADLDWSKEWEESRNDANNNESA